MKRIFSLAFFALFICCGPQDVIKIGVVGPMTGDQAKMGQDIYRGTLLAAEEWNGRGGVLEKKIVVIETDDRHDPREAVSVANKMVNDKVLGVVGHLNSSCSIPASQVYHEFKVVQITPSSTNPQLTEQGYRNVFRVCGRDDQQGAVGAKFVLEGLKLKRVAVIHDKTTYGQGLADEFVRNVKNDKATAVVAYEGILQGDNDFTAVLTKIKQERPEVVYFGGVYPEAGLLVKQMRQLGLDIPFVSGDAVYDQNFLEIGGEATEGAYISFSPSVEDQPSAKKFLDSYKAKFGEPGPYSVYAYDAANIILQGVADAKSTDGEKVAEAIHSMTYQGAMGRIQFDQKGDVLIAPYIFWTVKEGKFVPMK